MSARKTIQFFRCGDRSPQHSHKLSPSNVGQIPIGRDCALRMEFSPELEQDWTESNSYWFSIESDISDAGKNIYDGYLKSQGQELGIRSYDTCVSLLIAYYRAK